MIDKAFTLKECRRFLEYMRTAHPSDTGYTARCLLLWESKGGVWKEIANQLKKELYGTSTEKNLRSGRKSTSGSR